MCRIISILLLSILIFALTYSSSSSADEPDDTKFCSIGIEKKIERRIRDFRVKVSYANERMCQRLEIFKGGEPVYHEEGIDNHYSFENDSGTRNLTGLGIQLFVSKWTGGAHCCYSLLVFNLGDKFRKIGEIYGGNFEPEIVNLDHDRIPEVRVRDDFLAYRFSSFASSAKGTIILKYLNGGYILAEKMMRRTLPSEIFFRKQIPVWRKEILSSGPDWPPPSFIQTLTDLIFTGNGDKALGFVHQVWPQGLLGKEEFLKSYKEALSESVYYSKAAEHFQ